VGIDLRDSFEHVIGLIDVDDMAAVDDASFVAGLGGSHWLQALQDKGVFFSHPIDLDFAMLMAFPAAYRHARPGGHGPRTGADAVASKKGVTLKTDGNPDLYDAGYDDHFVWYPYLFLERSKPEAHIAALAGIDSAELRDNAPTSLRALIARVQSAIDPPAVA